MNIITLVIIGYLCVCVDLFVDFRFIYIPLKLRQVEKWGVDIINIPLLDDIGTHNSPFFLSTNIINFLFFAFLGPVMYLIFTCTISSQIRYEAAKLDTRSI